MKICLLADGGSIHTYRWCTHFASLGHEMHLITFKHATIPDTTVHCVDAGTIDVNGKNWRVLGTVRKIKKLIRTIAPDVLHSHYVTSYGLMGVLSGFHPHITTALGSDVLVSPFESFVYKFLVRFVLKRADRVTAMAEHMKNTMLTFGIAATKIDTIIFGINPEIFYNTHNEHPHDSFVITSTRNFEPVYNIPMLLHAINLVKNSIPNMQVHLIGDGTLRSQLEQMAQDLEIHDIVHFWGKLPQKEIAHHLNNTHLFVTVSDSDGNNISLNEAMACGCVSIATDIPANRQWIQDGVNGYFVSCNHHIQLSEKILDAYTHYHEMSASAQKFNESIIAEKALWHNNMEQMESIYRSLLKKT